jgi:hypothetical protein
MGVAAGVRVEVFTGWSPHAAVEEDSDMLDTIFAART